LTKELIINATPQGVEIALLEDKLLVELHNEKIDANFALGDMYLGKVKKLIPGMNAAFLILRPLCFTIEKIAEEVMNYNLQVVSEQTRSAHSSKKEK